MISESEKQKIRHTIMQAFDTFATQQYGVLFEQIRKKKSRAATALAGAAVEDDFLDMRAADINSYIAILDGRAKSKPVMKHRQVLVESAIRSIVKGDFELSEIGRVRDGDKNKSYTERQRRRLVHERYGAVFLKSTIDHKRGDKRVGHVSTVFSESSLPPAASKDAAHSYLNAAGAAARSPFNIDKRRRIALHSILRLAFPRFLDDMLKFRDECRAVFESLGERNDRTDYLWGDLVEGAGLLDVFYSHTSSMLDLVWFRTRSEENQRLLLKPAPRVKYKKQDAQRAREALTGIYGQRRACDILNHCGHAFLYFGRPRAAAWTLAEGARIAAGGAERGMMWQNVAAAYRINQSYKLALGAMKKALPHIRAAGDAYRACNALQLTGEFQWRLGHKEAAWKSFNRAAEYGDTMKDKGWRVPFILGMSFARLGEMRLRRQYMTKALAMVPEDDADAALFVNGMINDKRPLSPDWQLPPDMLQIIDATIQESDAILYGAGQDGVRPEKQGGRPGPAGAGGA